MIDTTTATAKHGTAINEVSAGLADWFLVEYNDSTASIHSTWDEAMTAGNFQTDSTTE